PTSTSLGPISINCTTAHSTTSPKTSPTQVGLLTTAGAPLSPPEDDISVTASPTPSPQPPPAFPGAPPPPIQNNQLFNNALAASLFLNTPLLPPPGQWFYSQFYPHDWAWMNLRHHSLLPRSNSPHENSQNPDSSSGKLEAAENDDGKSDDGKMKEEKKGAKDEGMNLSLHRCRKAAITLQ
ncbi:hypothetical protein BDFB_012090, partial [Asbolus verrucosus]